MRNNILTILSLCLSAWAIAQNTPPSSFSLAEAISYAEKNSTSVIMAEHDIEIAKKKVWETTAIGLPQANAKYSFSYTPSLPASTDFLTSMIPPSAGISKDDMKIGSTLDVTISQLIFNGSYIVGLQASRTYQLVSEQNYEKKKKALKETIANTYILALSLEENSTTLKGNYTNLSQMALELRKMAEAGFVESTNADQLELNALNVKNAIETLDKQMESVKNLLKFQLGIPLDAPITLTDKLATLIDNMDIANISATEFNANQNIDIQLAQTQTKLLALSLKNTKATLLPSVSAFYQHQENFNDASFSFTPPDILGFNVNIPIFGSGSKLAQISQAKLELEKMKLVTSDAEKGMQLEFKTTLTDVISSYNNYLTAKKSLDLAKKIYDQTHLKFKEGMASSTDVAQANTQYLTAQSTYFGQIQTLLKNKYKLDRITNK